RGTTWSAPPTRAPPIYHSRAFPFLEDLLSQQVDQLRRPHAEVVVAVDGMLPEETAQLALHRTEVAQRPALAVLVGSAETDVDPVQQFIGRCQCFLIEAQVSGGSQRPRAVQR